MRRENPATVREQVTAEVPELARARLPVVRGPSPELELVQGVEVRHNRRDGWLVSTGDAQVRLSVSVVIPTYNEAANLPAVLSQIPEVDTEVIVVDGHSRDATVEVARSYRPGIRILHELAKGKGAALRSGFSAAAGDIIVCMDADASMHPGEIGLFVEALAGGAALAKGSRCLPGAHSADITRVRSFGNWMLGAVFNRLYGTKLTDVTYGYLAFWRRYLSELMPSGSGFDVEASMLTSAALKGLPIVEVPCHEGRRLYGESKLRPFRDGSRILRHQLGAWWDARRRPAATVT